jgi:probable F420-dependent oxidoreductase
VELGLAIPHTGPLASPDLVRDYCTAAEELGYGSLWTVDHVVVPRRIESPYVLGRSPAPVSGASVAEALAPNYESLSTLLWVAGFTSRVRLGTAVSVLPLRNPVLNARMLASLDVYSGGRLIYGVGAGWLKEEADAMQMPWDRRGARAEEHIAVLRRLWLAEGDAVSFEGTYYRFPDVHPEPRPVQKPPPVVVGGHSRVAIDRAARIGDGWVAASMSPGRLAEHWDEVRRAAERHGRDPDGLLLVNTTRVPLTDSARAPLGIPRVELAARLAAFRDLGVDHLKLTLETGDRRVLFAATELVAGELAAANR